jgi:hypothetical protein
MVIENSDFYKQRTFSENYSQFGHAPSKKVRQACPRPKKFKECKFEGASNY